jgi:hypothetical protein
MQSGIRRALGGLAVLGIALVATPGEAAAAKPVAGCNAPFELFTVDKVVKMASPAFEADIRKADRNGDDYLCVKVDAQGGTFKDNTVPL